MKLEARQQALDSIAAQVEACSACPLHVERIQAVSGDGNISAEIMFISEAPGYAEDQEGLPFVGPSGRFLEQLLNRIGLTRHEVFITNVVKCRPPGNRDPLPNEMNACQAYLDQQIELVDPTIIVTLGRFSMMRYFPNGKISRIHGQYHIEDGRIYYPLYHPAAALRNSRLRPIMEADFDGIASVLAKVKNGEITLTQPRRQPPQTSISPPPEWDIVNAVAEASLDVEPETVPESEPPPPPPQTKDSSNDEPDVDNRPTQLPLF